MSTIDMTQVAGLQAVNEEGQVIGTLSVDDLTELVATKIVQEAKNEAVSARSASVMSEASTLAATDEYEDKLDIDTNPAYIRSMDSEGNPKRTATTSLATVVGGLLPIFNMCSIDEGTNLDNLKDFGIYAISNVGTLLNCPSSSNGPAIIIIYGYIKDLRLGQIVFEINNAKIHCRFFGGVSYSGWITN